MGVSPISVVRRASSSFGERALRVVARNGRVLERDRVLAVALAKHLAVLEGEETALGVLGRWSVNSLWLYAAKKRVEREQQAVQRALLQLKEMGLLEELRSVNPHACRVLELCFLEGGRVRSCKQAAVILKREGSLLSELGMSRLHDLQRHGLDFLESCLEFRAQLPSLSVMELAELLSLDVNSQFNRFKVRSVLAELEKMGLLEELRSVSARACRVLELRFLEGGRVRSCKQVAELLQHSEAWSGPASAVSVNSLQRNGFKLLKFVAGRQEQGKTLGSNELLEALSLKAKFYSDKLRLRRALSQLEGDGLLGVLECFQPLACRVLRMRFVEGERVRVAPEVQALLEKETSRVFGIYYLKSLEQRGLRALKEIVEGNMPSRTEKGKRFKSVGARDLFSGARTREQVRDILFFGSARETILLFRERFGGIPLQTISRLLLDEERHLRAYSVRCRNTTRNVWFWALGSGSLYVGSAKKSMLQKF